MSGKNIKEDDLLERIWENLKFVENIDAQDIIKQIESRRPRYYELKNLKWQKEKNLNVKML